MLAATNKLQRLKTLKFLALDWARVSDLHQIVSDVAPYLANTFKSENSQIEAQIEANKK